MANEAVAKFEADIDQAKACAETHARKITAKKSQITLNWAIDYRGKARRILVTKNTTGSKDIEECFVQYLESLDFQKTPRTIKLSIDYTYNYIKP